MLHALLAERIPGYDPGDSDLETRVLRAIVAGGLPVPAQQHRVRTVGRALKIDLAYPAARLAIELDGWSSTAADRPSTATAPGPTRWFSGGGPW